MKCQTKYCRGKPETKGTKFCVACRKRQSRERDPVKYAYQNIKNRAKQRNKPFTITLEYFRQYCYQFDYIANKGKTKTSHTIDCIINELGYVPGNIKPRTLEDNSRKGWKALNYDWRTKEAFVYTVHGSKQLINDNFPF